MTEQSGAEINYWHLDKRVPIALIVAIFIQTSGVIWWASSITARMDQVERRFDGFSERSDQTSRQVQLNDRSIGVMASELKATNAQLERLYQSVNETNSLIRQLLSVPGNPFGGNR